MGRFRGLGFLNVPTTAPRGDVVIICGASKRKSSDPNPPPKRLRTGNTRPIITMVLHHDQHRHQVKVLLDTGCSVALINQQTIKKLGIPKERYEKPRVIESFTGEIISGAGQFCTKPIRLQHRRHFSKEVFGISPMEEGIDLFLPFSWIERHPPQ